MDHAVIAASRGRTAALLTEPPGSNESIDLEAGDSAFCALTDFRIAHPITVQVDSSLDDALGDMQRLGIHALLVTREEADSLDQQVVGLVTYYDIERWRPHRSPQAGITKIAGKFRIGEVMTPWDELSLVQYDSLANLTAGEAYRMFQGTGLTHLLVIEMQDDDSALARGLISRSMLAKRLKLHRRAAGS